MNKKKLFYIIVFVLGIGVVAFFFVKGCKDKSKELKEGQCEYDKIESGEDLFCNYLSAEDYPKEPFFADMTEVYNSYVLLNGIRSVIDVWRRYEVSEDARKSLQCADINVIKSKDLRDMFSQSIEYGMKLFENDVKNLDTVVYKQFNESLYLLDSTLAVRYYVTNYAPMTEEQYWMAVDHKRKSKDLLKGLKCKKVTKENYENKDVQKDIKKVVKRIKGKKDFDEKCACAMAYVYYVGFWNTDFKMIEGLLDNGEYSPQLFFLWRIWRCGMQLGNECYGPSTWSVIPNKIYNEKRRTIAETTLKHIEKHRSDAVAINQFLVTAAHPNIMRDGQFPMGNESFTEVYYLGLAATDVYSEMQRVIK